MRALVFADRASSSLAPLDKQYAVPLLPIAGKELILYTVEELIGAGVREIVFVLSEQAEKLEALLGQGQRWGARFRFALSRGAEKPSAVWPRVKIVHDEPLLVLRGDLLRTPAVGDLLAAAQGRAGRSLCGLAADPRASLLLLRPGHEDPALLMDRLSCDAPTEVAAGEMFDLPEGDLNLLDSLAAYHRANLDVVAGRFRGLQAQGREIALGLTAGRRATVSPRSLKQGQAYVGQNSRISPEAELIGEVMIGGNVVVDRAATIYDSVILPHSYVGELVEVGNAIVSMDLLLRVDTGAVLNISDAFLLGRLTGDDRAPEGSTALDRTAGVALLLLSLPLWPVALAASALAQPQHGGKLTRTEMLIGNRRSRLPATTPSEHAFFSWRFNTDIPVLSLLPRILDVIRGDLRLFGVAPLTPQQSEARTEDWQRVRDKAPAGLLGPTQLTLPADAPLEERLMSDAFYAGQAHGKSDLRYLWQGLAAFFSVRAWQQMPATGQGGAGVSGTAAEVE